MKTIAKILCPVDFSDPSRSAVDAAVDLAEHFSAEIVLFHAINQIDPTPSPAYTLTNHLMEQIPQIMQQMSANAHTALKEMVDNQIADRVPSRQLVELGEPADAIVRNAAKEQVDLIVIATHGRSGIKGFFFGSVAEKVVRTADCPVLTVKHGDGRK